MQENGEEAIKNYLIKFMNENPTIQAISWCQYAPYFNDGDPCIFRIRSFKVKIDEDFFNEYDIYDEELSKKVEILQEELDSLSDSLENLWGDNSEITVTKEEIIITEYRRHD